MTTEKQVSFGCPICSKPNKNDKGERLNSFPFCCKQCKMIDLGNWLDGKYSLECNNVTLEDEEEGN